MQLRFSALLKDDIEHSGRNRKNGGNRDSGEKDEVEYGDKDRVMTWVEQQNVYEKEEDGKEKGAIIEMKITEVGRR